MLKKQMIMEGEKMFELYLEKPNEMKIIESLPLTISKDHEIKIRLIYGGICGSDLKVYNGSLSYASYPVRPGHEILGIVTEAGEKSQHKVGTRVVIIPNTYCGECEFCLEGTTNICRNKKSLGVTTDGVFAQEIVIDSRYAVPVPECISHENAALLEPFAVACHGIKKLNLTNDASIAVIGCGVVGLLSISIASYLGCRVTAFDVSPNKMEIAKTIPNVTTIHPNDIKDENFDIVIEAAGADASVACAMQIVKPGGKLLLFGLTKEYLNLPVQRIIRNELSIYGSIIYTKENFIDAIRYLEDSKFKLPSVISKIFQHTDFQHAFDDALSGEFVKILLDFR